MALKIREKEGRTILYEDTCCFDDKVAIIYDKDWDSRFPLTKEKATEYIKELKTKMESEGYHIDESGSWIEIFEGKKSLCTIYWRSDDDWKYGIKNKEEGRRIANKIVEIYKDSRPFVYCGRKVIETSLYTSLIAVRNSHGKVFAKFRNMDEQKKYFEDCKIIDMDSNGLKSYSEKWDRSIRFNHSNKDEIKKILYPLLDWMDSSGWRCK